MKIVRVLLLQFLFLHVLYSSGQSIKSNYQPFRVGLKWGIKDTIGNITLIPCYNYISKTNKTNFFIAATAKETQKVLISDSITDFIRNNTSYYGYNLTNIYNEEYNDSMIILDKPEFSIIDKTGKKIISENYDDIIDMNSCYICKKDNQYYFISADRIVKGPWDYYYSLFNKAQAEHEFPDYFVVNKQGEDKIFYKYDSTYVIDIATESEMLLLTKDTIRYRKGGSFSILNNIGEKVIASEFEEIRLFYRLTTSNNSAKEDSATYLSLSDSLSWKYISSNIYINVPILGKIQNKWGIFTLDNKVKCSFEYDRIELNICNPNFVYLGFKNTKKHLLKSENNPSQAFDNFIELEKLDSLQNRKTAYYIIQNGGYLKDIISKRDTIVYENWETGEMELKVYETHISCFFGGKLKLLNENLQQITNEIYDSLEFFVNDYTFNEVGTIKLLNLSDSTSKISTYEIVPETPILTCKNGLWGVLKPSGESMFSNKFNSVNLAYFNGKKVIETKCDELTGVITFDGKVLFEPDYNNFIPNFYDVSESNWPNSQALFYKNGKMGVINMSAKEIIPAIYDSISFNNEYYIVNKGGKRKHLYIEDESIGNNPYTGLELMSHNIYDSIFMINGKWGTIDTLGKQILETKYDQLIVPYTTSNYYGEITKKNGDLLLFTTGGKNIMTDVKDNDTLIDLDSYLKFPDKFTNVENKIMCNIENPFNGFKYGLVDKTGKEIISQCDTIAFVNWSIKDKNGENNLLSYIAIKGLEYIVFDKFGKEIKPAEDIVNIANSLTPYYDYQKNTYGLKDKLERIIIPPIYTKIYNYIENYAIAKIGNKFGFLNTKGELAIPLIYDNAEPFNSGKAKVKKGVKTYYIDINGNIVK